MKGYFVDGGYMGYVDGTYMLFSGEEDYFEYMEEMYLFSKTAVEIPYLVCHNGFCIAMLCYTESIFYGNLSLERRFFEWTQELTFMSQKRSR